MVDGGYVPDAGEFIWLEFDPQAGHEQGDRRPALVLSPKTYNRRSGLALVCPVTSQSKDYPFEVGVPEGCGITGVILADHVKSVDYRARRAVKAGRCAAESVHDVLARLAPLLGY